MISNQYETYLKYVDDHGVHKSDRTGTGTRSVFGYQMRFDLREGFPLGTSKKVHMRAVVHELIWFLAGSTNIKYLVDNEVKIWNEWADPNGELGPVYGYQWRSWPNVNRDFPTTAAAEAVGYLPVLDCAEGGKSFVTAIPKANRSIDQIQKAIDTLKNNPDSRRIIVSAWNPAQVDQMKLPPCHAFFQFYTTLLTLEERWQISDTQNGGFHNDLGFFTESMEHAHLDRAGIPQRRLDCMLYQRSCDSFLGVPFNIASYALLTHMFAQQCNMVAGEFIWTGGDCHIYDNHKEQVAKQLAQPIHPYPTLVLKKAASIFDYKFEDVQIENYVHGPHIPAPIAV